MESHKPLFDPFKEFASDNPRGILANLRIGDTINCFTGEIEEASNEDLKLKVKPSRSLHKTTYDICSEEDISKSFGIGVEGTISLGAEVPEAGLSADFTKTYKENYNYSWFMCRCKITKDIIWIDKPGQMPPNATHYVKEVTTGGEFFFLCSSDLVVFHRETFQNFGGAVGNNNNTIKGSIKLSRDRKQGDRRDIVKCYSSLGSRLAQNVEDIEDIVKEVLENLDNLKVHPVKLTLAPIGPQYLGEEDYEEVKKRFLRSSLMFKHMELLLSTIKADSNYHRRNKIEKMKTLTGEDYLTMCSCIKEFYKAKTTGEINDLKEKMATECSQIYPKGNLLDRAKEEKEKFVEYETNRLIPNYPWRAIHKYTDIVKRVAIIGKTGVGKSSLANYILCEERFKVGATSNRCTTKYQDEDIKIGEETLRIIDTPGFFDTNSDNNLAVSEIKRAQKDVDMGFHAFIFLAHGGAERDTRRVYDKIVGKYSGIRDYMIVVFNRVESSVPELMQTGEFSKICKDVQNRCLGVRTKDFRCVPGSERKQTMEALLLLINVCMHNNNGNPYVRKGCRIM